MPRRANGCLVVMLLAVLVVAQDTQAPATAKKAPILTPTMIENLRKRGINIPANADISFRSRDGTTTKPVSVNGGGCVCT
jgi:hypothetical protein